MGVGLEMGMKMEKRTRMKIGMMMEKRMGMEMR